MLCHAFPFVHSREWYEARYVYCCVCMSVCMYTMLLEYSLLRSAFIHSHAYILLARILSLFVWWFSVSLLLLPPPPSLLQLRWFNEIEQWSGVHSHSQAVRCFVIAFVVAPSHRWYLLLAIIFKLMRCEYFVTMDIFSISLSHSSFLDIQVPSVDFTHTHKHLYKYVHISYYIDVSVIKLKHLRSSFVLLLLFFLQFGLSYILHQSFSPFASMLADWSVLNRFIIFFW